MRTAIAILTASILALGSSTGCAMNQKKVEKQVKSGAPVDCRTAEADIRVLRSEKTHVAEQIAEGVTAIVPVGLVIGLLAGTEGTKIRVAIGEYNKVLDQRILLIQSTCGVQ